MELISRLAMEPEGVRIDLSDQNHEGWPERTLEWVPHRGLVVAVLPGVAGPSGQLMASLQSKSP